MGKYSSPSNKSYCNTIIYTWYKIYHKIYSPIKNFLLLKNSLINLLFVSSIIYYTYLEKKQFNIIFFNRFLSFQLFNSSSQFYFFYWNVIHFTLNFDDDDDDVFYYCCWFFYFQKNNHVNEIVSDTFIFHDSLTFSWK